MEKNGLQKVVSEILEKTKEMNDATADYQALTILYKQRKAGYEQDQKAALRAGDQEAYAAAVKNAAEQQILIDFAEKNDLARSSQPAISYSEAAKLSARLYAEIESAYREKARTLIPLLEEVKKVCEEAEQLNKMHSDFQGMIKTLAKGNAPLVEHMNLSCCFSLWIENKIKALKTLNNLGQK